MLSECLDRNLTRQRIMLNTAIVLDKEEYKIIFFFMLKKKKKKKKKKMSWSTKFPRKSLCSGSFFLFFLFFFFFF